MKILRSAPKAIAATAALALAIGTGCSKKDKDDDAPAATTATAAGGAKAATETATVTADTSDLVLAESITLLPAKGVDEGTTLALTTATGSRKLHLRVNNEAFAAIDQAVSIMCFLSQTKFWEQANLGVYSAQIDEGKCEEKDGGGGGGGGGGSGGSGGSGGGESQAPAELTLAYVESIREEGKPLIGNFRIAGNEKDGGGFYNVRAIVVAAPSDDYPAGIIDIRFTHINPEGEAGMFGFVSTNSSEDGKFTVSVGMDATGGEGCHHAINGIAELEKTADDEFTGVVVSKMAEACEGRTFSGDFKSRFDANFLNVVGSQSGTDGEHVMSEDMTGCYDRNKYKTAIYRYDLTDADGATVALNSGFPAEVVSGGKTYQAHASYWGLWVQGDAAVATGDTVYKVDWSGGEKSKTAYTALVAPGKLIKNTKKTTTLGDIKGVDMNWWYNGTGYVVKWNGTALVITGKQKQTENGMEEEAASGDVTMEKWGTNLWVNSLNANINIPYGAELSNSYKISYFEQTVVSGTSDVPSGSLLCFSNCPVMNPTAAAFQRNQGGGGNGPMASDLYKKVTVNWGNGDQQSNQPSNISSVTATYSFNAATMNLVESSTEFALPSGLTVSQEEQGNYDNVWSGALITAAQYAALTDRSIDPWSMENGLTVFYRFQAGPQNWNKFQGLKDSSGTFVTFDKPIDMNYTLTTEDEFDGMTDTNVVGKTYRLSYGGPGQFWGIPWKYNKNVGHHMPLFSLKSGTQVGDYFVYPLEGEQRMESTDDAFCADLSVETVPDVPEVEEVIINHGDLGDETSPLRYIAGAAVE